MRPRGDLRPRGQAPGGQRRPLRRPGRERRTARRVEVSQRLTVRRLIAAIALATLLAGCGGTLTAGGVTILRYGPMTGSPAALASGTLRFLDGCTILENIDPNGAPTGQVILWPPGTDVRLI